MPRSSRSRNNEGSAGRASRTGRCSSTSSSVERTCPSSTAQGGYRRLRRAPTAADLASGPSEHYVDLPGHPVTGRCSYQHWFKRIGAAAPNAVYAHVVTEPGHPGRLALQYWLYYVFNDYNDKHESDWEQIQLHFDADTVGEALRRSPVEVLYSQHEGAERAAWQDDKLEKVGGTHVVTYPGAGSHANYYRNALWLGRSADEGLGCDDSTAPSTRVTPSGRRPANAWGDHRATCVEHIRGSLGPARAGIQRRAARAEREAPVGAAVHVGRERRTQPELHRSRLLGRGPRLERLVLLGRHGRERANRRDLCVEVGGGCGDRPAAGSARALRGADALAPGAGAPAGATPRRRPDPPRFLRRLQARLANAARRQRDRLPLRLPRRALWRTRC